MHEHANGPKDKFKLVYIIHVLLGTSLLFPYNAFITAVDYFSVLFPGYNVENYFTIAVTVPNLFALLLSLKVGRNLPFHARVWFGFLCFIVVLGGTVALVVLVTDVKSEVWISYQQTVFFILVGGVSITGLASAILQGSIFGFAGMLPPLYTQAVMGGNAVAGVAICVCRVMSKLIFSSPSYSDLRTSALLYFSLAVGVVGTCLFLFQLATKLPFTQFHMRMRAKAALGSRRASRSSYESGGVSQSEGDKVGDEHVPDSGDVEDDLEAERVGLLPQMPLSSSARRHSCDEAAKGPSHVRRVRLTSVFHQLGSLGAQVMLTFMFTLAVFPAIVVKITSQYSDKGCWLGIIIITLFNVGDLVGRLLAGWVILFSDRSLWIPVLLRVLFLPFFTLMAKEPSLLGQGHNAAAYGGMVLMAISNGYLGSLAMMFGPAKVQVHERELAGTFMVLCLTLGLASGSCCSLLLNFIIDGDKLGCLPEVH